MIKSIYFRNFKSLKDVTFNVIQNINDNQLYLIYGENGSGKSNIVASISLLSELTNSFNWAEQFELLLLQLKHNNFKFGNVFDKDIISFQPLSERLKKNKRLGSKDKMILEYTLLIDSEEYVYTVAFDNDKLVKESLRAPLVKNQIEVFNIEYANNLEITLNDNLFLRPYRDEIEEKLRKYFGKHTLLSLVKHDHVQANIDYMQQNTNEKLLKFINYIDEISVLDRDKIKLTTPSVHQVHSDKIVANLKSGIIEQAEELTLNKTEELLDIYFKALYSDIKQTFYKKDMVDNKIHYSLYFKKMIGGDLTAVPADFESRGTLQLLELFPYFVKLLEGGIVVIDEFATGVHDILTTLLVEKLEEYKISGQLIATTHNTMLLDKVNKNRIFIIDIDDRGNKAIYNLKNSGTKIQPNHSIYNNYKKGAYGGVPLPGHFDFGDLKECLDEK